MKKLMIFIALIGLINVLPAQEKGVKAYEKYISTDYLKECLYMLASPTFEGRETARRGQKLAATFIQYEFEQAGLQPIVPPNSGNQNVYQMPFPVIEKRLNAAEILLKKPKTTTKKITFEKDFIYFNQMDTNGKIDLEFIFAGYGTEKEINEIDIKGKAVVVYGKENWLSIGRNLREDLKKKGAKLLVFISQEKDFTGFFDAYKRYMVGTNMELGGEKQKKEAEKNTFYGVLFMNAKSGSEIFGKKESYITDLLKKMETSKNYNLVKKIRPRKHSILLQVESKEANTENVLGYLEGTDLKDELIILTAHYDHLGKIKDEIFFGADDDASGTSAILAMAKAFSMAKKNGEGPRRSILFMTVSGEEKGLLGSDWYVEHPLIPLKNTIVNLNIDMIGRVDPDNMEKSDYVYLVGSDKLSDDLHSISESVNKSTVNLRLDYTYNDEKHPDRIYYRSDHWNFAKKGIPVIFYFDGINVDYHLSTDTPDKIDYNLLKKRTDLIFNTAWDLANRKDRIKLK